MTTNRMGLEQEDDYGLSAQLEVLEAMTAPGDAENQQLICLLLELKRRRATAALDEAERAELLAYRKASSEAVADVVPWNKPGEERKCDIRWRRFDVAPGPLFAAPPLQAVRLPPEFHSEHGVVVQLEKVMAALAVHGIKYERRHQKVVGLRAGIDAVRAEGIDVDAEKINAEKCHK